jgi:16S rRNA (uracil1498-N3)-methyltransferase
VRLTRVFVDSQLAPNARHTLRGAAAGHITRVLRLRAGDELTAFDGHGGEYQTRIESLRKDSAILSVGEHRPIERESPLILTLAQGVSRGERMDFVMQKATELGVRRIVPILAERTVVRLDARAAQARLRHWHAILVAACEQCGRNRLPELDAPRSLSEFLATPAPDATRIVLAPQVGLRVRDLPPAKAVAVLVGPEGGLTQAEQQSALAAGFRALSLGPRILRTETAGIAALAAMQERLGDL